MVIVVAASRSINYANTINVATKQYANIAINYENNYNLSYKLHTSRSKYNYLVITLTTM